MCPRDEVHALGARESLREVHDPVHREVVAVHLEPRNARELHAAPDHLASGNVFDALQMCSDVFRNKMMITRIHIRHTDITSANFLLSLARMFFGTPGVVDRAFRGPHGVPLRHPFTE